MTTITDDEFGTISLRRSSRASQIRIKVAPDGRLVVSLPLYAPVFLVKRLISSSRSQLRTMLDSGQQVEQYEDGMHIGKSHTLVVRRATGGTIVSKRHGQQIVLTLPEDKSINDPDCVRVIRDAVRDALRIEAKSYLPKRLAFLAEKHDFSYQRVRFSHASGRWGSCSTSGTISLNIALMKLPFELIDYVLIHELCHTLEMNHSDEFWRLVESCYPEYKQHRKELKKQTPTL